MTRRILIVTLGSRGDVHPYIALGAALQARGARCAVAAGAGFDADIEARGLRAATLDVDFRPLLAPAYIRAARSLGGVARAAREMGEFQSRLLASLWRVCREQNPDAIVFHHNKGAPAAFAARALETPAIPTALMPAYLPTGAFNHPFTPFRSDAAVLRRAVGGAIVGAMALGLELGTRAWRKTLGLSGRLGNPFDGYDPAGRRPPRLHFFSPSFVPKPPDWPERDMAPGCCFLDRPADFAPPPDLADFIEAGPPPLYVGQGSMPLADEDAFIDCVAAAMRRLGRRAVVMAPNARPRRRTSKSIFPVTDVPHDWLFPRCDAILHHGGAGTTQQALRWGKPSVLCPVFLDQPFWADMAHRAGAAARPLPARRITPSRMAARFREALVDRRVAAARAIGARMALEDAPARAAETILGFLDQS